MASIQSARRRGEIRHACTDMKAGMQAASVQASTCEYRSPMSFPRKTFATNVPPGFKTCVTMVRAARMSCA